MKIDKSETLALLGWQGLGAMGTDEIEDAWSDAMDEIQRDTSFEFDESLLPPAETTSTVPCYEPLTPFELLPSPPAPWTPSADVLSLLDSFKHVPKPKPDLPSSKRLKLTIDDKTNVVTAIDGHMSNHVFTCQCPCLGYSITVTKIGAGATCASV